MKRIALVSVLALVCVGAFSQTEEWITLKARAWFNDIGGDFSGSTSTASGTDLNYKDDFNVQKVNGTFSKELVGSINLPLPIIPRLNFGYWTGNFDKTTTLASNFTFAGKTYNATDKVESKTDVKSYTANLEFEFPFLKTLTAGTFSLGFIFGGDYYDSTVTVTDKTAGFSEARALKGPLPVIGAVARFQIAHTVGLEVSLRGFSTRWMGVNTSGYDGSYWNANVEFNMKIFGPVIAGIGYHYILIDAASNAASNTELAANLNFHGFFLTAGASF